MIQSQTNSLIIARMRMTTQNTRLNLVAAHQALDEYLKNNSLNSMEKAAFFDIKNRIRTLLKQSSWLNQSSAPHIVRLNKAAAKIHSDEKKQTDYSQDELFSLTEKTYDDTHVFTKMVLDQLVKDYPVLNLESVLGQLAQDYPNLASALGEEKRKRKEDPTSATYNATISDPRHRQIVAKLRECLQSTLTMLQKDRPIRKSKTNLAQIETMTFNRLNYLYQLINHLGGTYIPTGQRLNPLLGSIKSEAFQEEGGTCAGHVVSWALEVEKRGYSTRLMRSDAPTVFYQDNQEANLYGSEKLKSGRITDTFRATGSITHASQIRPALDSLLENLSSNYCYYLRRECNNSHSYFGHAMGIRRIPSSEQIEFVDSNIYHSPLKLRNLVH
jgi:hypothetical protein